MNPLSSYQQRYRLHQAYSKYPRLSLLADVTRTVCLCGFVATVAWFGYTVSTHKDSPYQSIVHNSHDQADVTGEKQAVSTQATDLVATADGSPQSITGDIEIPAVANTTNDNAPIDGSRTLLSADERKIYESDWIFLLSKDKFVIQFGSSADRELVYEEANTFPTGPVAVYPFKKTPSNKLVYGYSSGVYNSLDDARRALDAMPKDLQSKGPWIRPVGRLQNKIMQLSSDS